MEYLLSYDVASWSELTGSEITPCNKIDKTTRLSGLQIFGKCYELTLLTFRIWQKRKVFTSKYILADSRIQNLHFGRSIVGYMVGNLALWLSLF